jgi:elongation factor Ts
MMDVNANLVRELREKTGAGVMDCKKALAEAKGDLETAVVWLREKGIAAAAKRAGRVASEGAVGSYIHAGGKLGVLVEVNCESDFVAKTPEFQTLVKELAMQIAAANPRWVTREEVPADAVDAERTVLTRQAQQEGKPERIVANIVEGRIKKFFEENCLLGQPFVKDGSRTVGQMVHEAVARLGENIVVRRFVRFGLGEVIGDAARAAGDGPAAPEGAIR